MGLQAAACHSRRHRSTSSRSKQRLVLQRSALRLYRCARCGMLALVCSRCEHNQIYCNRGCAKQARLEGQRRAGARHQRSGLGRRNHADRQAAYRSRKRQKVTHHTPHPAVVLVQPCTSGPASFSGCLDKEMSHVCAKDLPILSRAFVPSATSASALAAAIFGATFSSTYPVGLRAVKSGVRHD